MGISKKVLKYKRVYWWKTTLYIATVAIFMSLAVVFGTLYYAFPSSSTTVQGIILVSSEQTAGEVVIAGNTYTLFAEIVSGGEGATPEWTLVTATSGRLDVSQDKLSAQLYVDSSLEHDDVVKLSLEASDGSCKTKEITYTVGSVDVGSLSVVGIYVNSLPIERLPRNVFKMEYVDDEYGLYASISVDRIAQSGAYFVDSEDNQLQFDIVSQTVAPESPSPEVIAFETPLIPYSATVKGVGKVEIKIWLKGDPEICEYVELIVLPPPPEEDEEDQEDPQDQTN